MVNCDVCGGLTTWDEGTGYTSDEFRTIVRKGFEPAPSVILRGPSAVQGWKNGLVANSTTGWLLCPTCAARASRYMPKRSGTGPAGHVLYETMTVDKYLGIDLQEPDEPDSMDVQAPVPIQTSPASSAETCYGTKKTCPTCKKEIEARAVSCQYCNAEFEITNKGYCSTERAVVDADEKGLCLQCGKEVLDEKIESRMTTPGELPGLTPLEETESASVMDEAPASIKKTDTPAKTFKKCPMCAEEIPLMVVTCEYCGTQFEVTSTGYCQNCHQVREADVNGQCKVCGNTVLDLRVESRFIEEPVQEAAPIARPEIRKTGKSFLSYGILAAVLIFGVIGALLWFGRNSLAAIPSLFATITPTSTVTRTATPTSTPTHTPRPTPTATPIPAWVTDFLEPILTAINDHKPNLADDFEINDKGWESLSYSKGLVSYENGELLLIAEPNACMSVQSAAHPVFADFVLDVDVRLWAGNQVDSQIHFRKQLARGSWFQGVLTESVSINHDVRPTVSSGVVAIWKSPVGLVRGTNHLQIIAKGPQIAVLINKKPVFFAVDPEYELYPSKGEIHLKTCSNSQSTSQVYYDNLMIWDISDVVIP